jgi:hypothetical protein
VPRVCGELLEKDTLGSAVAIPERVNGVDLAQVVGHPVDEGVTYEAPQEILLTQLPEDPSRGRLDEPGQAEHAALGDGHCPDLASPVVDVAEDPAVDGAQVGQVVGGPYRRFSQPDQGRVGISRSAASSSAAVPSPSLLWMTPVTGSVYGSAGTYCRRYLATVRLYSSAALISPST